MAESRHSYLILAHKNWMQLQDLLSLLDHPQNDIYLHVDRFARGWDASALQRSVQQGTLKVLSTRYAGWGSESLIDATLDLLRVAAQSPHAYYHLISGMDLPLRPQEEIHAFFANAGNREFVDWKSDTISSAVFQDRLQTFHLFQNARDRSRFLRELDRALLRLQAALGVNRLKRCTVRFQKGSQWFSITQAFAEYCLRQAPDYRPYFRFSKCADELFFQTILQNSPFQERRAVETYDDEHATMRYIDWDRGSASSPYVFRAQDLDAILQSGMLFARKFDETIDPAIIQRIKSAVFASSSARGVPHV